MSLMRESQILILSYIHYNMEYQIFDDVNKLLAEYDFGMNENTPEKVKCLKCLKILTNACQVSCGCRYCRVCVDRLVESGCRVCPGNKEFCNKASLSNFNENYQIQKKISKLVVKCPQEKCSFKSELIHMNEHLRVCPMKSMKCIFYGLACDQSNLAAAKMSEHLDMLEMGVIDNMRNEIDRLKEYDERNKKEIEILKRDSMIKAEKIESLEEEIKLMKGEREILATVAKLDAALIEIRKEWRDALDSNKTALKETNGRYQTDMDTRMSAAEKWMDKFIDGTFFWIIDNVAERRENEDIIRSEYFYGKMQPYKIALTIRVNDYDSIADTGLRISVWVYADVRDQWLKWSLPADVSIKIVNKSNPNAFRIISKNYTIKKPIDNSRYQLNDDCDFDFLYADLRDSSLLIGDSFIVECRVDVHIPFFYEMPQSSISPFFVNESF